MSILYVNNDNVLTLDALTNAVSSAYINSATVTATVKDTSGNIVTGTSSLTLSYVAGSNGKYRATLVDTLPLTEGASYIAYVTADGGDGLLGKWQVKMFARKRAG